MSNVYWLLYEVFVCGKQGLLYCYVGSLYVVDEWMVLENVCDVYICCSEGCLIWVVKVSEIVVL